MKRKIYLIIMSAIMLILNCILLSEMLLDEDAWLPDIETLLSMALISTPTIVLQYVLLEKETISVRELNVVMFFNIDWFPVWYGFILFAYLLGAMHGDVFVQIHKFPILSFLIEPFIVFTRDPFYKIILTFLSLKLIMYILLRIALKQEQKNSNKKLHGRVTENIDTKKTKI